MKNMIKKGFSLFLAIVMISSAFPFSAFALSRESFRLDGAQVTIDGSSDQTVKVSFVATEDLSVMGIEGSITANCNGIELTGYEFPVTLTGLNTVNLSTGAFSYSDDNLVGFEVNAGESIFTGIYTVPKETVKGQYAITFNLVAGQTTGWEYFTEASYEAVIDVQENNTSTNTGYEVYYEIEGIASSNTDSDNYIDINPGAEFSVGVYVKSTDDTTKKMQAFDIYPTWDTDMLSYVSVADATGKGIVDTEMGKANPHFYSVMKDLNLDVSATGVKIATLTLKLSTSAVHDTGYNVGLSTTTNLAVEENAESVPVTVDTTEKGAETLKEYTVTYNANDGTGAPAAQTKEHNKTLTLSTTVPTRDGYGFNGWNTVANGTGTPYAAGDSYTANADVELFAQWTANTVEVTLDANGGKFADDSTTKTVNETFGGNYDNIFDVEPTRVGYTFAGWFVSTAEDADKVTSSSTVTDHEEHTLYAQWTPITYTVKFDGNEADSGSVADVTVAYNVEFTMPENGFARTGWKFNGWNTAKDGTGTSYTAGAKYQGLTTEGEITLYAQWTQASYDVDVDDGIQNGKVELDKEAANYQDAVIVTVTPNDGYEIGSVFYYLTADADKENKTTTTITVDNDGKGTFTMPAGNVTVSATFTAIPYDVNVATGITHGSVSIVGENKTTATIGETVKLNVLPETGYEVNKVVFVKDGETTENTIGVTDGYYSFTMPAADVTVNAEFVGITSVVTLNPNGGAFAEGDTTSINATYAGTYSALAGVTAPTRTGYTFAGWSDAASGGNTVTASTPVQQYTAHQLYAQWTANEYTITFVTNGGTITADGVTEVEAGEKYTMKYTYRADASLPAVTKALQNLENWIVSYETGATEKGWGDAGATVAGGSSISDKYGDVTLTADWAETFTYAVEDYKYAPADYVMLRIAASAATGANSNAYAFNSEAMYYTEDTNYLLGDKAVFVTLIPKTLNEVSMVTTGTNGYELTPDGLDMISQTDKEAVEIARDGKINKDDVVNIADANAVYQMVISGGNYYSLTQLDILSRLEADMDTSDPNSTSSEQKAQYRGSILDVDAIVTIINNNANSTTTNP